MRKEGKGNSHLYLADSLLKIPKSKHSQITIFIIIALIFLIIIIFGFFTYKSNIINIGSKKIAPEISFVHDKISECINQRAIDALGLIGLQGGYVILPPKYVKTDISNSALALSNQKNNLISLEDMERQIKSYLELTVPYCVSEFKELNESLEIRSEKVTSNVEINENVKVLVNLPLSIKKGEQTFYLKAPYEYNFDIRLKKIHETANKIIDKQLEELEYVDLTFLSQLDLHTTFIRVDETTGLYVITDEKSMLDDIEYSFMFGVELG